MSTMWKTNESAALAGVSGTESAGGFQAAAAQEPVGRFTGAAGEQATIGKGLVITDSMDNIRRIQRLISQVDNGDLQRQSLKHYKL